MSSQDTNSTSADLAHAMSTLTEEERAAMADELSDDERASLKAVADAAKIDADEDEGEDDTAAAAAAPAAAPAAPAAAPAAAAPAAPAEAPAAPAATAAAPAAAEAPAAADLAPAPLPTYDARLPDDYKDRVAKLDADNEALDAKLEAGEITPKEFRAEQRKLKTESDELTTIRTKVEIAAEFNQQQGRNAWANEVGSFIGSKPDGVDYKTDAARGKDLDFFIKALASDDANDDKPMRWFITEAHKRVVALHGPVAGAPAAAPAAGPAAPAAAPAAATPAAPPSRKPNLAALPVTLAGVPGADGPGDVGDEFADLDLLDGPKLEAALRSMSVEKRERYLAGT